MLSERVPCHSPGSPFNPITDHPPQFLSVITRLSSFLFPILIMRTLSLLHLNLHPQKPRKGDISDKGDDGSDEASDSATVTKDFVTSKRADKNALRDLALSVVKSKKIICVTGAGISCSSGIPVSSDPFLCFPPTSQADLDQPIRRTFALKTVSTTSSNTSTLNPSSLEKISSQLQSFALRLHLPFFIPSSALSPRPRQQPHRLPLTDSSKLSAPRRNC